MYVNVHVHVCKRIHVHVHVLALWSGSSLLLTIPLNDIELGRNANLAHCSLLPTCLVVISNTPSSVYRVCDLFTALMRRNGAEWRTMAIAKVRHQVRASVTSLGNDIAEGKSIGSMYKSVIEVTANLIHLLVLLMEVRTFSLLCM